MPAPTMSQLIGNPNGDLIREAILAFLTGSYPDGTAYSLPTTASFSGGTKAATSTTSSVASSDSSVQLLAANTNRLGATVYNDSTAVLYLKLGAVASATDYTVQMAAGSYYEVPFSYVGRIDGIWASANGNARLDELTA